MDKNGYVNKTRKMSTSGFGSGKHQGALHDVLNSTPNGTLDMRQLLDPLAMPSVDSGLMYKGSWEQDYNLSRAYDKGDYFMMNSGDMKVYNGGKWETLQGATTSTTISSTGNWQTMPDLGTGTTTNRSIPYDASPTPPPQNNKFPPVFIAVTYPNGDRGIINVNRIIIVKQTQRDTTIEMEDYTTVIVQEDVDVLMAKITEAKGGTL